MFFKSFFDEELAQMSYMTGCQRTGEAMVIDPARDINPYLETADKEGFTITKVTETHIHADFLSGARELAQHTGATLYLSNEGDNDWKYQYLDEVDHVLLNGGDQFHVGNIKFDVLHTPGHTPESISFVLTDEGGGSEVPMGIFTGDFVFVGDVGRPDLLEKAAGSEGASQQGARQMFQSLEAFKELPDFLQVWPGHGAGSACGKSLGAVPVSTVGYEKANNWALQHTDIDEFTDELIDGQPEPPKYFGMMKKLNKEGPSLEKEREVKKLTVDQLEEYRGNDAVIIDTREKWSFAAGHIPGTINIPYNRSFSNWAGWLVDYDQSIVLIGESSLLTDMKKSLEAIGLDDVTAYVDQSDLSRVGGLETYTSITPEELEAQYKSDDQYVVIDVRNPGEWEVGHMDQARHLMLGHLKDSLEHIPKDRTPIVHCQSGVRSAIAVSLLQANGFKDTINLKGGYAAWKKQMNQA
ncbi:MBL fold metallo-hydrolase [Halobacillus litoralis]|uniref:MBL fold metallo-hydrolase n=1 Tax=Halobacillus litoralis TaxID=45668 RepID=A0A845DRZ3_9BACI|nr:MBL fold metallo-hydrolase [Halobacillus litoralis]MYL20391.1 MBL fold metallo-hydrolase [Halobacillus litoralis]